MRQIYLDWVNWWFDHPIMFVVVVTFAAVVLIAIRVMKEEK